MRDIGLNGYVTRRVQVAGVSYSPVLESPATFHEVRMGRVASGRLLRFGRFELDVRTGELRNAGRRVALSDQPLKVLSALLERPGELVTREELRQRLWSEDTFVEFENGLNAAVKRLRDALRDSPDAPRYIETFPRRGYRFVAPVDAADRRQDRVIRWPASIRSTAYAAVALALVGATLSFVLLRQRAPPVRSVAVLPINDASGSPDEAYMADGLTAELIGRLSRFQGLAKVVGRDSLMRYRHATKSLREIAQELDVDAVISGSVTRSRDNVRITVGLAAAYCVLGRRGDFPARQAFSMAKAAALRSLQLDPFLPDGYSALGTAVLHYDWDWAGAGRAHGRAVELNPNSSQVRFAYGEYLRFEWPLG